MKDSGWGYLEHMLVATSNISEFMAGIDDERSFLSNKLVVQDANNRPLYNERNQTALSNFRRVSKQPDYCGHLVDKYTHSPG